MIERFSRTVLLCVVGFVLPGSACQDDSQGKQRIESMLPDGEWQLTFSDEFDGNVLNANKWNKGFGWGMKSGSFGEGIDPDNVSVTDGMLILKMEDRPVNGGEWASGAVNTKDKFFQQYGYFEIRMRVPKGMGFLTGFWSKSNDERWPPEIDFVEVLGKDPELAHFTVHFSEDGQHKSSSGSWKGVDLSDDFHIFGCAWSETEIIWYVDGIEKRRTSVGTADINSAKQPFYLMVNTHIGHSWSGFPDESTPWPAYLHVDWVRVYARKTS